MKRLIALAAAGIVLAASAPVQAAPIVSVGPNTAATAQNLNGNFTLNNIATVTNSTTVPHVEITRNAGGAGFDFYSFSHGGGQVIIDIDGPLTNFDTEVSIWNSAGIFLANNDDNGADPGSNSGLNSFLSLNLAAGDYIVAVSRFPSNQGNGFAVNGPLLASDQYNLNISANNVPEPATLAVFGLMAAGAFGVRRRLKATV